jgi:hypothetical protein
MVNYTEQTKPKETRFQCRHILTDGHRCESPCLRAAGGEGRHEPFCYFHHTTRHPATGLKARRARQSTFEMPLIEDRSSIQAALGEILSRIASNDLDSRRAGLLLYGLQIATLTLPPAERPTTRTSSTSSRHSSRFRHIHEIELIATVIEIIDDPDFGTLAPDTPYRVPGDCPDDYKSLPRRILDEFDAQQAQAKAARETEQRAEQQVAEQTQPAVLTNVQAVADPKPSKTGKTVLRGRRPLRDTYRSIARRSRSNSVPTTSARVPILRQHHCQRVGKPLTHHPASTLHADQWEERREAIDMARSAHRSLRAPVRQDKSVAFVFLDPAHCRTLFPQDTVTRNINIHLSP